MEYYFNTNLFDNQFSYSLWCHSFSRNITKTHSASIQKYQSLQINTSQKNIVKIKNMDNNCQIIQTEQFTDVDNTGILFCFYVYLGNYLYFHS